MQIKILGTRGEVDLNTRKYINHSGILIDKTLLFDLGEKKFLKYKPKYIFITHLHPDHAFFIRHSDVFDLPFFAPEKYKKGKNSKVFSKSKKIGPYLITAIPTYHSLKAKSVAYLIKKGKKKILYSGDLIWIAKKYHPLMKNLDLVITEASFMRQGGMVRRDKKTGEIFGHTGVPNLIHLFKKFTSKIILIHFGSWFLNNPPKAKKIIHQLSRNAHIDITAGFDGMELKV